MWLYNPRPNKQYNPMKLQDKCKKIIDEINQNTENLEVWAVGGAVRDDFLNREYEDIDFTVLNETEQSMKDRGFEKIDAQSFPVFHDDKGNEYALARKEKSTGDGYHDFETETENVQLQEDLVRRDFTINAMAQRVSDGVYEYPVAVAGNKEAHSVRDLNKKIIRHINESFSEDPVRILRMARFASRLPEFEIAHETMQYAQENSYKLDLQKENPEIPAERVKEEIIKAMKQAEEPRRFWEVMKKSGALHYTIPELAEMEEVSAGPEKHHKEGDTWTHTMMAIEEAQKIDPNNHRLLLMTLFHDIGKIKNKDEKNKGGHDKKGIPIIEKISERLNLSNELEQTLIDASKQHMRIFNVPLKSPNSMKEKKVLDLVKQLDHEKGATQKELLNLCQADSKGRIPSHPVNKKTITQRLDTAREAINKIDAEKTAENRGKTIEDFEGETIGQIITQDRIEYLKENQEKGTLTKIKDKITG